jgi:hypothetical protein
VGAEGNINLLPSPFTVRGRRVDEQSDVGVSQHRHALTVMPLAELTHPVFASLDHPFFCKQKSGLAKFASEKISFFI